MHGFHGQLLHIDLSCGKSSWHPLAEQRLRAFLGGIGLGTRLLYDYAPPGIEPLAAGNPLILASAPLVGTGLTTTAKFAVVTKSPLSGFIGDSLSSSHFALALKRLGVDAVVITGQAAALVYLLISDKGVEIRDAEALRGKTPGETETIICNELKSEDFRIAAIGRAGEHLVRFATISNEGRHAGRGGASAVMGSKNLKAIAVCGRQETQAWDAAGVRGIADRLRERSLGPLTEKYRNLGTVANLAVFNRLGVLPARNFQQSTFDGAEALSGETLAESQFSRSHGCAACTIRCERLFKAVNGEDQRLEYETLFALGPLCGVHDPQAVTAAARLCDRYGLDTISTGGTLAWAMECSERGLLPEAKKLNLFFGRPDALLAGIEAIARRDGIGDLLAEGSRLAAQQTGQGSGDWAMHVKGLELPGYEPRSLKTMALGLAVSPRGACHNRSGAYEADFSGAVDRFHGDSGRGAWVAASEDFAAVLDSLIICKFLRKCFGDFFPEAADLLAKVTGWDCSASELERAGGRIVMLKRAFNQREGWQSHDDWLPPRLLGEAVSTGVAEGLTLEPAELKAMISGYYRARGLDENGFLTEAKLRELQIPAPPEGESPCPATKHGDC